MGNFLNAHARFVEWHGDCVPLEYIIYLHYMFLKYCIYIDIKE